jgi:hypothetical protein
MMRPAILLLAAAILALGPGTASAQQSTDVRFAAGASATTLEGRITGREYHLYRLGAEAGQRMTIRLSTQSDAAYFNLYAPGKGPGDAALATSEMTPEPNHFDGLLPQSGVYTVSVYLYRNAARDGATAAYRLDIGITGGPAETVQGDFADGLQGGPDDWRVAAGNGLNLRSEPSRGATILTRLPDGLPLRNLGCRMAEGGKWCRVATLSDPGLEGWVSADYLVEGTAAAAPLPDMIPAGGTDALVSGTGFNATGKVECAPAPGAAIEMCDFGVIRDGGGTGTVTVTLPDGRTRAIFFANGIPVSFDRSEADGDLPFDVKRTADGHMVFIGQASVILPEAVLTGG